MNIVLADKVLFVADGAHWIWDRAIKLLKSLGLKTHQILQLLDFYHAVEHLHDLAKLITGWGKKERDRWIKTQRHNLRHGKLETFFSALKAVCGKSRNKELRRERDYFLVRNKDRLDYGIISNLGLPLGSGAIESAVRRVVNLRMKGP